MRIYLDNCCFNRPYDNQNQIRIKLETEAKLFIQYKIAQGHFELVWSYILDFENEHNPFENKRENIKSWKSLSILDLEETEEIITKAKQLSQRSLKSKDALHIACAIIGKCDFFLSTDDILIEKMFNYSDSSSESCHFFNNNWRIKMLTDTEIKMKGMEILTKGLGLVEAERFVSLMMREPFDYTKWQQKLWLDKSIEDISHEAMKFRKNNSV